MGLFDKFAPKLDYQEEMTKADIDALEKQGCDVTEMRAQLEQKEAKQQEAKDQMAAAIHLEKLDEFKSVPRSDKTQFFTDIAGKPPMFGKDKWRNKFQNAELVYAAIVQAHNDLWEPGEGEYMTAVLVYTNDKTLRYDIEWLTQIAEKIMELKNSKEVPKDCKDLIKFFRDDQSRFYYKVGHSITGGVDVWCETNSFPYQGNLPNKCLPPNGIVPFLLYEEGANAMGLIEIPGKYYI